MKHAFVLMWLEGCEVAPHASSLWVVLEWGVVMVTVLVCVQWFLVFM